MTNFKLLSDTIRQSSENKEAQWKEIIEEWRLVRIDSGEDNCLCGKDIKELCVIQNIHNLTEYIIGNECIKKICPEEDFKSKTHLLFDCITKLKRDIKKAPNKMLIEYCKSKDILDEWELKFTLNTYKKRKLSDKQLYCRKEINKTILKAINI